MSHLFQQSPQLQTINELIRKAAEEIYRIRASIDTVGEVERKGMTNTVHSLLEEIATLKRDRNNLLAQVNLQEKPNSATEYESQSLNTLLGMAEQDPSSKTSSLRQTLRIKIDTDSAVVSHFPPRTH